MGPGRNPAQQQLDLYYGPKEAYKVTRPEAGLAKLALFLNWRRPVPREAEKIVLNLQRSIREGRRPSTAIKRFNRLAEVTPVRLHFQSVGRPQWNVGQTPEGLGVVWLWEALQTPS